MIEVAVERLMGAHFMQIRWHLVRPYPITVFAGFFHGISTEAHHFALNHHVETIAVG